MTSVLIARVKIALIGFAIAGCATRPVGDDKNETVTGFRTMLAGMWCGVGFKLTCPEKAIEEAKMDCAKEGKVYEYSSHEVTAVRYKCVPSSAK